MPLHLLHHKSYHVYSAENIARVRRDEADAAAREAAEDARVQAADAEARMTLLRERASQGDSVMAAEKKPKHGTEEPAVRHIKAWDLRRRQPQEGGILGVDGHVNLFPAPTAPQGRDPEREREKREEKEREEGAMGTVVGERRPWYSSVDLVSGQQKEKERDGRKTEWEGKREEKRKEAGDPLGVIKRGVRGVKEARRDREEWKRRRERDVGGAEARGWPHGRDGRDGWDGMAQRSERGDRGGKDGDRKRKRRSRSRNGGGSPSRHDTSHKQRSHSYSYSDSHSRSHRHKHRRNGSDRRHHPRSHHRRPRSNSRPRSKSPNPTLESLRNEKSQRESTERQKAVLLLAKVQADSEPGWKPAPGGRYSSQFGHRPG